MSDVDDWAAAINALAANAPPAEPPEPEQLAPEAIAAEAEWAALEAKQNAERGAKLDADIAQLDAHPGNLVDLPMAPPPTVEEIRGVPTLAPQLAPLTDAQVDEMIGTEAEWDAVADAIEAEIDAEDLDDIPDETHHPAPPAPAQLAPVTAPVVPETFEQPRPTPVRPPDAAPATGLSRTAVLVDFTRTGWSASVRDKSITDAVITQAGAKATAGHFHKNLLPDKAPCVEAVKAAIQNAYEDYRTRTAPWLDSGTRIMSTNGFQEFTASQREHAGRIEAAKRVLRAEYDDAVDKQRATLGTLFNPADYPTADEVVAKYQAGYRVLPVPDSTTDFRMAVGEQERAALKAAYDEYTAEMLKANRAELARRVDKEVRHLADRMKTYNGGQTGSFRDTLIENVRRMAGMLDSINITGDPEVTALADRIKADLCQTDVAQLRDSARQRRDLAAKADSILADMSNFIA